MSSAIWYTEIPDSHISYLSQNTKHTDYYFEAKAPKTSIINALARKLKLNKPELSPPFTWPNTSVFDQECSGEDGIEIISALIASMFETECPKQGEFPGPVILSAPSGHYSACIYSNDIAKVKAVLNDDSILHTTLNSTVVNYLENNKCDIFWWNTDNPIKVGDIKEIRNMNKNIFDLFDRAITNKNGIAWYVF